MTNECIKRCSTSLAIKEIEIKTYSKIPLHPLVALIKKTDKSFGKDVEKLESLYSVGWNVKWYSYFGEQSDSFSEGLM